MKIKLLNILFTLLLLVAMGNRIHSQSLLAVHPSSLNFGTQQTSKTDSLALWLVNKSTSAIHVTDIYSFHPQFFLRDTNFTIAPSESVKTFVYFFAKDNLTFNSIVLIENNGGRGAVGVRCSATAEYPDTMYAFTQNLLDEPLKTELHNFVKNHNSFSYSTARYKMFETVDDYNNDDSIECVYTGRKVYAPTRSDAQNQGFNTEHTWPQSFFNSATPMVSDVYHLYPTDDGANNVRSNYPFGIPTSNITWQQGGSKLGKNSQNQTVFEPRDIHKGNVARSLLYFIVRYDTNYGGFLDNVQEFWLRRWNASDAVNAHERTRNNRIASFQLKRNPFIDQPEFVDRISKFSGTAVTTAVPEISVAEKSVNFGTVNVGDTSHWALIIVNSGNDILNISSLQFATTFFSYEGNISSVAHENYAVLPLRFIPTTPNQLYEDTLTIMSNDNDESEVKVFVAGNTSPNSALNENNAPLQFSLSQNYPNPFNPQTTIGFSLSAVSHVTLNIYNLLGQKITTLINNEHKVAGNYRIAFDAKELPSGIYLYKLTAGKNTEVKKMVLMK